MKRNNRSDNINHLSSLLREYEEILLSHAQAKIVSLPERRRILRERHILQSKLILLRKDAVGL